jgi:hypothetical protein
MFGWIKSYFRNKTSVQDSPKQESECLRFVKSFCSQNKPEQFIRTNEECSSVWFKDIWIHIYTPYSKWSRIYTTGIGSSNSPLYILDKASQDYILELYKDRIPNYQNKDQELKDKYLSKE